MTGFGRAVYESEEVSIKAEVKTLNSKFSDTIIKIGSLLFEKEIALKNILVQSLTRGKIVLSISYVPQNAASEQIAINMPLVKSYYEALSKTAETLGASQQDLFKMAMEMPNVYVKKNNSLSESDWEIIQKTLNEALTNCNDFRLQEGAKLEGKFSNYIGTIAAHLQTIETEIDAKRVIRLREKLTTSIEKLAKPEVFDANRFEQEVIYYMEKLDISEEKVRLKNHLDYFTETLQSEDSNGKKLNFISQEIGREINTIGSKANDSEMQKLVVNMKEELEKIKEQLLNVL